MLGMQFERLRARSSAGAPALGFGGGFVHVVQVVGLLRALTVGELLGFNAGTQIFNLTVSDEPLAGVLKAHVPAKFGLPAETIISMLEYSQEVVEKLIATVGRENVRDL
jgi:hypothetical protein